MNKDEFSKIAEVFQKSAEKLSDRNGDLQVQDYYYIFGDITLVIIDKNNRYVSFGSSKYLADDKLLIASCVADAIGSLGYTTILKLRDKTRGDFKNEYGYVTLYKEI